MGLIFSRVRKKPPTDDVLKELENELQTLEEYRRNTEQKKKRLLGTLIFYSIFLYLICAVSVYFYWYKSNLQKRMLFAIPLVIFPFAIWGLKLLLQWIFRRRLELNLEKLTELHKKKRSILNQVKETETYSKAKEILEKYDPEFKKQLQMEKEALKKAEEIKLLRRRSLGPGPSVAKPKIQPNIPVTQTPGRHPNTGMVQNSGQIWVRPPGPPLPRPILPRETGVFDKFVDYVIGDGPSNRYALICQQCFSHNGMALKEEFEYLAFRCCYCYGLNPAKKFRPYAPRLPVLEPLQPPLDMSLSKNNDESVTSTVNEQQQNEGEVDKSDSEDVKEISDMINDTEEHVTQLEPIEEQVTDLELIEESGSLSESVNENLEEKKQG